MAQRRFGPTAGAGVAIVEKDAQKAIQPGMLGTRAYTGILQKGPVGKVFRAPNRKEFEFRAGGYIPESLLPNAAMDTFDLGQGAGDVWFQRVTDGSEKKASLSLLNRRSPRSTTIAVRAGNGGRWAGKKAILIDQYDAVTAITLQLDNVPASLKKDELAGALVRFSAIPGKSFAVLGNTAGGLLSFNPDIDLVAELGGSADKLVSITLANDGNSVAIKILEGTAKPSSEFRMDVFTVEGEIATRRKSFDNLSTDPAAPNYFVRVINDDSDKEFLVEVEDLFIGTHTADVKPSNYSSKSLSLTATVLKAKIWDEVVSSANSALAELLALVKGASIIEDTVLLTCSAAGARASGLLTFGSQPDDGDSVTIAGKVVTFKTTVVDPLTQVAIGTNAEGTIDNLVAFINAQALLSTVTAWFKVLFVKKASAATMSVYAMTAGVAGNAITTVSAGGANKPTFGAATLASGLAQTWTVASEKMPFISGTVTSGVAFAAANEFGFGFTLIDVSRDSAKTFGVADTVTIYMRPLEVNKLIGGFLFPKYSDFRKKAEIISNTADEITVKAASTLNVGAAVGDVFRVEYLQELGGGYDGIAEISDTHYVSAYDTGVSALRNLRGKNLGLIKLATPGVTSTAVQKAGAAFAESQNWQYRYEVPANITSESAAEEWLNSTVGRNDFAVCAFPSFAKVLNPVGQGLKLVSLTGAIQGVEAKIAKDFSGYHKAEAGVDAILSNVVVLPDGLEDKVLDEEFLNPIGLAVIKKVAGNFVIWGDRTVGNDTAFKFKHHREQLSYYENTFLENFDYVVFALNNKDLWAKLKSSFITFFEPEHAKGAIVGDKVTDAARIKIDSENNTVASMDAGDANAEVGVALADTVERFIITVSKLGVTERVAA